MACDIFSGQHTVHHLSYDLLKNIKWSLLSFQKGIQAYFKLMDTTVDAVLKVKNCEGGIYLHSEFPAM